MRHLACSFSILMMLVTAGCGGRASTEEQGNEPNVPEHPQQQPEHPEQPQSSSSRLFVNSGSSLYTITPDPWRPTKIGDFAWPSPLPPSEEPEILLIQEIAIDKHGRMFGLSPSDLYRVDTKTAKLTHVGPIADAYSLNGLSFVDRQGKSVLIGTEIRGDVIQIDTRTGATSRIYQLPSDLLFYSEIVYVKGAGSFVAANPKWIYDLKPPFPFGAALLKVDVETGATTQIGDVGTVGLSGMFQWRGKIYAVSTPEHAIVEIDPKTGKGKPVFSTLGLSLLGAAASSVTVDSSPGTVIPSHSSPALSPPRGVAQRLKYKQYSCGLAPTEATKSLTE